jgi:hypothetical protein
MTTAAQVLRIAPSLSGDSRITDTLSIVSTQLSAQSFGTNWSEAVAALTAHRLLASPESGTGAGLGSVSSVKTGKRQVNYAQPSVSGLSGADADLMTTAAGRYYMQLRDSAAGLGFGVLL